MKSFAMFVLLCCVLALAVAAPQPIYSPYLASPYLGTWAGLSPLSRTVVAGPTVVNGLPIAPGYIGTTYI